MGGDLRQVPYAPRAAACCPQGRCAPSEETVAWTPRRTRRLHALLSEGASLIADRTESLRS